MINILVQQLGMQTALRSVQGRVGQRHLGVPVGGAMDQSSALRANRIVGNNDQPPVIEVTLIGPTLKFDGKVLLAISGAELSPTLDGEPVRMESKVLVQSGQTLRFGKCVWGCRAYVAVAGGFEIEGVADLDGRDLRVGACLQVKPHFFGGESSELSAHSLNRPFVPRFSLPLNVVIEPGPECSSFAEGVYNRLLETEFRLAASADRMGYRLEPSLYETSMDETSMDETEVGKQSVATRQRLRWSGEMISSGVFPGVIQVPDSGHPILLMRDAQTTGGYPRIAVVRSTELDRLAQLKPGDGVRFCRD